jgi:hypothetical protein
MDPEQRKKADARDNVALTKHVLELWRTLDGDAAEILADYKQIKDFILPRRGRFDSEEPNKTRRRHSKIMHGVAGLAMRVLVAGMQGGLTSPARPWFQLILADQDLMKYKPVKSWLSDAAREMYTVFSRSNFYHTVHGTYFELGGFGTALSLVEEDLEKVVIFKNSTAGEYRIANGPKGIVDTVVREIAPTADAMARRWGQNALSHGTKMLLRGSKYKPVKVYNAIFPNTNRDIAGIGMENAPFMSVYIEANASEKELPLEVSGHHEFPGACPRWDVVGSDAYGTGPAYDALADVKQLQEMDKSDTRAVQKTVDPPMLVPPKYKGRLSLIPSGITYHDGDPESVKPLLDIRYNLDHSLRRIQDRRELIREFLYNDLFLMIMERPNMTATEVAERHEEKLLMLGPVIERQFHEHLDPIIDRVFNRMLRLEMFPPIPEELQGVKIDVEYVSLLAQAQKLVNTNSIEAFGDFVTRVAQINPEIIDKFNVDEAADAYADYVGLPPKIVRDAEEVAEVREARAAAVQQQAEMEQATQEAKIAKDLGSAQVAEGESALQRLTNTMEAA